MYFVTSILLVFSAILYGNTNAQQVGSTLVGSVDSAFGQGLSLSSNGLVLAVGAPGFNAGSDTDAGQVSIYNFDGTNWIPGTIFIGTDQERIGDRISLSATGEHLAFRRARISTPDVAVVVDTASGNQLGQELSCAFNGFEVSLAPSGTRVAVSCETFSATGRVEIFDLIGNTWISAGTIDGDGFGSLFGWVTAFDLTGNRLAVSAPNQDSNSLQNNGMVRVYDYDGVLWNQVGNATSGDDDDEQLGFSLDISSDGTALVAGSPQNDGNGTKQGRVTTYRLIGGTVWQLMGSAISGEVDEDRLGRSVSVSSDGSVVAVSSYLHNSMRGQVRAFGFDGTDWIQLTEIEGASEFDFLGLGTKSVALDDYGSRLAFGISGFDNVQGESIGAAEVFDIRTLSPSSSPSMVATLAPTTSVLLAGGTITPTITLSKFDWNLERIGNVSVAFTSATDTEELVLDYSINLRDYAVQIFEEDCLTLVPQSVIDYSTSLSITNQTHGDLVLTLDVIQGAIVGSNVWSNMGASLGLLSVCVRVDLLNTDAAQTSVNFHEQKLFITIDLTQDFHVENIDLERIAPSEESETVEINYEITACHCDESYSCNNEVQIQGSDLYICVFSNEPNVDIISVPTVHLKHENVTYIIVENSVEDSLTDVTTNLIGGSLAVIRTQLISELFNSANPGNLTVWGDVVLSFVARRRLGEPLFENRRLMAGIDGDTEMEGFNIEVSLVASSNGIMEEDEEGAEEASGGAQFALSSILFAIAAGVISILVAD